MARYSHYDMAGKVNSLKANLDERYKKFFCIVQELLQNADDAGATSVIIGQLDHLSDPHELCRIPGIFVLNNGPVSDSDLDHIFSIADSNKGSDEGKIGKFGLGMKSVFHLCETFFIFGHQSNGVAENQIVEFFDPWDNKDDLDAMPEPHPQWRKEFNNSRLAIWQTVNDKLKEFHNFGEDWFALWIPLRQRNQCNGGSGALLDYFPLESNAKEWFTVDDFRKISGMMPFFKHLRKINFVTGELAKFGSLELIPDKGTAFTGSSRNEWTGTIISDKQIIGKQTFHGWEYYGNKDLEQLRQSEQWPTVQRWDDFAKQWTEQKDKTSPHAAICYCSEELSKNDGFLTLQECVFLPLSEMQQTIPLSLPYNVTISFHGQYFVDAGRRRYKLEDDKSVDDIKIKWNNILRSELLLTKVLQTFADFFNKWNIEDIKTVLQRFTGSDFWSKSQYDICKKSQFLLCLTKSGWSWKREDANQNFILLPDVKIPELLQAVFQRINKNNLIVQNYAPRLGVKSPSPWPSDQISRLWDAAAMLDEKSRYDSITLDFLEQALNEIRNTEKQLPSIQKYLKAINMAQYRNAREQLGRIFKHYPHCTIQFAKDNWTTASFELWKRILALATDCLPLDVPPDETISFRYTERDLQKILPELEKELSGKCDANCKAVIRDLVCSCFRNSMIDWQTSPLAKCRLFSVQDQLCSFTDLKQMHSCCRLFRQGGDIQTPIAIKKAVRWNFETLPFYYCDALKNILDIGVFSKEKHIPEIFRIKPDLSDANNRIDLLKKLKAESDTDKYYNAVRYLLHGQKDQYEYYGDIEIPDIPTGDKELFSIGIKLLGELNREKTDFNIPSDLIAVFSEIEMESFDIKKLRFEDVFRKLKNLSTEEQYTLCEKWRTPSNWKVLLNYLNSTEDLRLLADLPIWHCRGNIYTKLDKNCFIESDISIPHCVKDKIKQLDVTSVKDIEIISAKLPQSQLWNDCHTVEYCTAMPWSQECANEIWDAIEAHTEQWERFYLEKLFAYPLFETQSGKWISFMQVTTNYSIPSAEIYSWPQLTEQSQNHWNKLAQQAMPDRKIWTSALAEALGYNADFAWGELPEQLCSYDKFKELFTDHSIMPVLYLLEDLGDKINADELLRCIKGNISQKRCEQLCSFVAKRYEQYSNPVFMDFLQHFVRCAKYSNVDWKHISLPNIFNQSRFCSMLVRQADGVDQRYVLHPDLRDYFSTGNQECSKTNNVLPTFADSANLSQEKYNALTAECGTVMQRYFASWPEELRPAVGAFMLLAGNNPGVHSATREFLQREPKLIWEKISTDFAQKVQKYSLAVKVFEGNSLAMTSLTGEKIDVPLQDNSELDSLLIGEDYYNCRLDGHPELFIFLALRQINPETLDKATCLKLLINTAKRIVARFDSTEENIPELFGEMKNAEQFDLQTTRSLILKELPTILKTMNLHRDNELKSLLREWNNTNKYKTQAELEKKSDLSEYDQKFQELLEELQELFENFEEVREETLTAIRRRISTAEFGYELSSIPFELFQNADDAAAELQKMQNIPESSKEIRQSFVIELTDNALNIIHWGRPINQYQYPGFDHELGEKLGFGDDLQKMLLLGVSDKSDDTITRTGKFGLGFKSIFLLTDNPLVLSNRLCFSIQGGLLPKTANQDEKNLLQTVAAHHNVTAEKITVFHLPLRDSVGFDLEKFKSAAPLLVRFARKINEIRIIDRSGEVTFRDNIDDNYCIWDLEKVQLAMGQCDNIPASLPQQVATIWVTSPTQITKNFGFAVNGNFNLDVGRNQLLNAPENKLIAQKGAECLFDLLVDKENEFSGKHWNSLWNLFSNGENSGTWSILNTEKSTAQVLRELFWGSRENPAGYGRYIQHHQVLPTMLPGIFSTLTSVDQIKYAADDKLSEFWRLFEDFVKNLGILPGEIAGQKTAKALENIYGSNYLPQFSLSALLQRSSEKVPALSPDMINGKNWKDFIDQCGTIYQYSCENFQFLNRKGKYCPAASLLILEDNSEDESLRAAFAPAEALISEKYDDEALKFFRYVRKKMGISVETLAQWAYEAETSEKQKAVLYYLAEGELQEQIAEILRAELPDDNWLKNAYQKNPDNKGLKKLFLNELKSQHEWELWLQMVQQNITTEESAEDVDDDIDSMPVLPATESARSAQNAPGIFWQKVYADWQYVCNDKIRKYNNKLYDVDILEPFPLELRSQEDRDRWMALFTMGAAHALGRTKVEQHSGFVRWCKYMGYWETFAYPEIVAEQWIDVIDRHIEGNDAAFGHWMRLYPAIYLFAKYLDEYVEMFSQWKDEDSLSGWRDLAEFRNNHTYNGTDFNMPDLKLGLGHIGRHFIFRELYRSNTLQVPGMERYCFVHSEQNRQYFQGSKVNSEDMYNCLSQYLDDPTFGGQFDVAFECIER